MSEDTAKMLKDARIALKFYRLWMEDNKPGTSYPFGVDSEKAIQDHIEAETSLVETYVRGGE